MSRSRDQHAAEALETQAEVMGIDPADADDFEAVAELVEEAVAA